MECAFLLSQTAAIPDPFLFTVEYYGYSENPQFPGYLVYEIESIGTNSVHMKRNNSQYYWALSVNGIPTLTGAYTTFPGPGSIVLWRYTPFPKNPEELSASGQNQPVESE